MHTSTAAWLIIALISVDPILCIAQKCRPECKKRERYLLQKAEQLYTNKDYAAALRTAREINERACPAAIRLQGIILHQQGDYKSAISEYMRYKYNIENREKPTRGEHECNQDASNKINDSQIKLDAIEKEKIEKEAKSLIDAEEKKHKAEVEELRKSISQLQQENDALMHTVKGLNTETGCSSGPIGRKSTD